MEQVLEPLTMLLLIVLMGKVEPLAKVVLLNWNELSLCAKAGEASNNRRGISEPSRIFIKHSFLTYKNRRGKSERLYNDSAYGGCGNVVNSCRENQVHDRRLSPYNMAVSLCIRADDQRQPRSRQASTDQRSTSQDSTNQ